jgi:hypothetical protein
MITAFIVVAIALVALGFFVFAAARGHGAAVASVSDLQGRTRPVDLAAFRNLIDPDEEEYLRANLPSHEFRVIQRERLRAAIDYVRSAAANASVLLRLGEAARRSDDAEVAAAGQELVTHALRLRMYAPFAEAKLRAGILWPEARISHSHISDSYENMAGLVNRIGRLQHYPKTAGIMAAL